MAGSGADSLVGFGTRRFFWGCRILYPTDFVYIYGAHPEYWDATNVDDGRDTLHKGCFSTLEEARQAAEDKASSLAPLYEGMGAVRVMTARAYLERTRGGRPLPVPSRP